MTHLLENWGAVRKALVKKRILLLLDYDGTLTPIVSRPGQAKIGADTKRLLKALSRRKSIVLGIVSGRKIEEVKRLVRVGRIYYAGNHGFEIEGKGIDFVHPSVEGFKRCSKEVKKALKAKTARIKGAAIEDKGATLSFHYRLVDRKSQEKAKKAFFTACRQYRQKGLVRITRGKKVLELRPPAKWNKADAVNTIKNIAGSLKSAVTIYAGDDRTDEDAFRALKKKDISIFVGAKKDSNARYFLKDTSEVKMFLKKLAYL